MRRFLKGWFTIAAYMRDHRAEAVKSAADTMKLDPKVIDQTYPIEISGMNFDGSFDPPALDVIRASLKDLGISGHSAARFGHARARIYAGESQLIRGGNFGIAISRIVLARPAIRAACSHCENLSLDVAEGEFVTLLGPSGCGKSTLLNIIGGLLKPAKDRLSVHGRQFASRCRTGSPIVFQESTLFPWYTVAENFAIQFRYRGVPRGEWESARWRRSIPSACRSLPAHYPKQLSVGMRQRVNLARGIASGTDILLMDEPFAALDEQSRMVLGEDLSVLLAEPERRSCSSPTASPRRCSCPTGSC